MYNMLKQQEKHKRRYFAVGIVLFMALHVRHILFVIYPYTELLSPYPVSCKSLLLVVLILGYLIVHVLVFSFTSMFDLVDHVIIWFSQAVLGGVVIYLAQAHLDFIIVSPVSVFGAIFITVILGSYGQRCASQSWNAMSLSTLKYAESKQKVSKILDELLPDGLLNILERMDVNTWHEISKVHDDVAVVMLNIKNIKELANSLQPGELVTVLHTAFSVCDRILKKNICCGETRDLCKIESVSGSIMVCSGLRRRSDKFLFSAYAYACECVRLLNGIAVSKLVCRAGTECSLSVSAGVSVGPVITGVLGSFPKFCVYGYAVDAAAKLMNAAQPGTVMVTEDVLGSTKALDTTSLTMLSTVMAEGDHEIMKLWFRERECEVTDGLGVNTTVHVLEPCEQYAVVVQTSSKSHPRSAVDGPSALTAEPRHATDMVLDERDYYASRAQGLWSGILFAHVMACIIFTIFVICSMDWMGKTQIIVYIIWVVLHVLMAIVYRVFVTTRHAFYVACGSLCVLLAMLLIDVALTGSSHERYHDDPAFYVGFDTELFVPEVFMYLILYRIPARYTSVMVTVFAVLDSMIMYCMYYPGAAVLMRLMFVLLICIVAVVVSHTILTIDIRLFEKEKQCIYIMNEISGVLRRLLPPHVVTTMHDRERAGLAHYALESSEIHLSLLPSPTVSPLVQPIGVHQSSAMWQKYDKLVVFYAEIMNFSDLVGHGMSDPVAFFGILRQLCTYYDRSAESSGLWRMYTSNNIYVAVSGFPQTPSSSDPVGCAIQYARDLSKYIEIINSLCKSKGFPDIVMKIGLAAGSAVTAIVGEYHPAYLIWGQADDRARDVLLAAHANSVLLHPSVIKMKTDMFQANDFSYTYDGDSIGFNEVDLVASGDMPVYLKCT